MINKIYCMSHYLAFRFIKDECINFYNNLSHKNFSKLEESQINRVSTIAEIDCLLRKKISNFFEKDRTALLLSGGIDSAILASYLPEGAKTYTLKCVGENSIDETERARKYCDVYGLEHDVIEIYWSDFENLAPALMKFDGVPFHSIEVMLVKAARYAKQCGIDKIIIGDAADYNFGGMDKLLSTDWMFDEFVSRYNAVNPDEVLNESFSVLDVYEPYRISNDKINYLKFFEDIMDIESYTSYMHAFNFSGIKYIDPYLAIKLKFPLDLSRIRNGEPKYMLRELFKQRYPNFDIPTKIPMPRSMDYWLKDYSMTRPEFIPESARKLTGDQKWLCWCLETFLNMHENKRGCPS